MPDSSVEEIWEDLSAPELDMTPTLDTRSISTRSESGSLPPLSTLQTPVTLVRGNCL